MNRYRLFLLSFATVCLVFTTGFGDPDDNRPGSTAKQVRQIQIKEALIKSKQYKARKRLLAAVQIRNDDELRTVLDLSLPLKDAENIWQKAGQASIGQDDSNVFVVDKRKQRSVDLNGQMLMSQEPETDKKKSLDGAAIVINLKR